MAVAAESMTKWVPHPKMLLKSGNDLDLGNISS